MKKLLKKIKPTVIKNYVYAGKDFEKLPVLKLPESFTLKIFDDNALTGINIIDRNKSADNTCYAVFENDRLAHISWVYKNNLLLRQLGYDHNYYTMGSYTDPAYRGKGIFSVILNSMMRDYADKRFLGFVDPSNEVSIKGLVKAGLEKWYRFKLIRVFGLKIYLKKYAD